MTAPKQPTIKDVAERAGVSITTVSFVLNHRTDVTISEETKKRVFEAARELHYHPSALAAGLAGKKTHNIGLVFFREEHTVSNQFYSFIVEGAIKEIMGRPYNLLFSYCPGDYHGYQDLPKAVREKNVDGVLLMNQVSVQMVQDIQKRRLPVVLIDPYPSVPEADTIAIENEEGARLAVEHLTALGHRRIAMLAGGRGRPSIEERIKGFREAYRRMGLAWKPDWLWDAPELSFQEGYERTIAGLRKCPDVTALFCANDETAAGALRAARESGFRIPKDFSVVGFDNITMSNYTDPPLTTVSVPKEYMGKLGVLRLLELIERKERPSKKERVPVELQVRASTAKRRA